MFGQLAQPGTPLTTREVADGFDCTDRTIYNKLDTLVDEGAVETKKGGARGRVWWRPPEQPACDSQSELAASVSHERTERREAETDLRDSERRLRLATEAGEIGVWELDLRTSDSPVRSPRHVEIFGYEKSVDDWSFEIFLEHVHPDDRESVGAKFNEAFQTGFWEFECRIIRAGGTQRWITAKGEFYFDEGEPVRAVGIVRDVTERKEARQALIERTQTLENTRTQLQAATDATSVGTFEIDLREETVVSDEYLANAYGIDPDRAAAGAPIEEYFESVHEEDRERVRDTLDTAVTESDTFRSEYRVWNSDDDILWVVSQATVECDEDGEPLRLVGAIADITEQKRREQRLARQRERIETLQNKHLETTPTGVLILDENGEITLANDHTKEMFCALRSVVRVATSRQGGGLDCFAHYLLPRTL